MLAFATLCLNIRSAPLFAVGAHASLEPGKQCRESARQFTIRSQSKRRGPHSTGKPVVACDLVADSRKRVAAGGSGAPAPDVAGCAGRADRAERHGRGERGARRDDDGGESEVDGAERGDDAESVAQDER